MKSFTKSIRLKSAWLWAKVSSILYLRYLPSLTNLKSQNTPNLDGACNALDLYDIDYDLDDGDRIMVDDSLYDDALDAFDEYDIEYEEV